MSFFFFCIAQGVDWISAQTAVSCEPTRHSWILLLSIFLPPPLKLFFLRVVFWQHTPPLLCSRCLELAVQGFQLLTLSMISLTCPFFPLYLCQLPSSCSLLQSSRRYLKHLVYNYCPLPLEFPQVIPPVGTVELKVCHTIVHCYFRVEHRWQFAHKSCLNGWPRIIL